MTKWLARVGASPRDLELTQQNYSDRFLKIEEYEQEKLIASPRFEACSTSLEARNEAIELFAMINAAIKLVARDFAGLRFKGISELRDGQLHQYIFANLHVDLEMIHSLTVTGGAASVPPRRSLAERMTELMERDDRVREAANTLLMEPVSFGNLNLVYETVKGLMSPKKDRTDWENLVNLGWISEDDSKRFFKTAGYYRHGHPRTPIPINCPEMSLEDATPLISGLFRQMIEKLQSE